jgi:nucleoside-diphosphate-sugar epimerase
MAERLVLVFGGGGYVGSELVSYLLTSGYKVRVLDTFWYGRNHLEVIDDPNLELISGDVRDLVTVKSALKGVTDVIHLACISNDPSFDLNPELAKSINLRSFEPVVLASKEAGVVRFIFASTSSVYGVKTESKVVENLSLEPLTDYSAYKAKCEKILLSHASEKFICTILRPATICGVSTRQRFDLSVNILTNHAINMNRITVYGGSQQRPNLHIKDMCRAYVHILAQPASKISGKTYNVGAENLSLDEIAIKVQQITKISGPIEHQKTNDLRSYRVDSSLISKELGFNPEYGIEDAIQDLVTGFRDNKFLNPLDNPLYFNIKKMKELKLG